MHIDIRAWVLAVPLICLLIAFLVQRPWLLFLGWIVVGTFFVAVIVAGLKMNGEQEEKPKEPMPFRPLEMVAYCRHCGDEITSRRFAEYQACEKCNSGTGWPDDHQG